MGFSATQDVEGKEKKPLCFSTCSYYPGLYFWMLRAGIQFVLFSRHRYWTVILASSASPPASQEEADQIRTLSQNMTQLLLRILKETDLLRMESLLLVVSCIVFIVVFCWSFIIFAGLSWWGKSSCFPLCLPWGRCCKSSWQGGRKTEPWFVWVLETLHVQTC